MKRENDIKAPDGYLLGGLRRVRADGTILFQRGFWQAPKEWAGHDVWVHEEWHRNKVGVEAAPPGVHIYRSRYEGTQVWCEPTGKPDAKPGYRDHARKAWFERMKSERPGVTEGAS